MVGEVVVSTVVGSSGTISVGVASGVPSSGRDVFSPGKGVWMGSSGKIVVVLGGARGGELEGEGSTISSSEVVVSMTGSLLGVSTGSSEVIVVVGSSGAGSGVGSAGRGCRMRLVLFGTGGVYASSVVVSSAEDVASTGVSTGVSVGFR